MQVASDASSDAELIAAVRGGDSRAYGALYERHAAAARAVARQYVRTTGDADDVVADAFARVLGVLRAGGGPDVTFRAYLFTVVRRLAYGLVDGARRTEPTDDDGTFESAFGPLASTEDPALAGFERSVVARAYRSLPERWQAVLWYSEVEDLHPAQIAPILGLTANGVAALAYRAREGLRQAYLQQHLTSTPAQECERINPLLGSYVRDGLAKRETVRVEDHLQGCAECSALVLELSEVSHGMRTVVAPLVLGAGALGLVGTALPVAGGGAIGAGTAGAVGTGGAAGAGGTAGTAGTGGVAGAGAAGAGVAGTGGTGAAGGALAASAGGTGAAGVGAATAGTTGAMGAVGATAATGAATTLAGTVAGVGVGAAGVATVAGATVATGATGIVALIGSAPIVAVAVTVGVATVTGLGIAGAMGAFSPTEPTVQTQTPGVTDAAGGTATGTPEAEASPAPSDATTPTNIPTESAPAVPPGDAPAGTAGDGGAIDDTTLPGEPIPVDPGLPVDPVLEPLPSVPPVPQPLAPALDLSLGTLQMSAREPADLHVTASNGGSLAAEQVVVDVTLPAGVSAPGSVLVAGGSSVVPALRAEALPCGGAVPQTDGTSVVTCDVGTLDGGATRDLVITVTADSGGEYAFSAAVSARGVERVTRTFQPLPVTYYGPQVRVGDVAAVSVANPGATRLSVPVRNSGDVPATGVAVAFSLPPGLGLDVGDASGPGGWNCARSGADVTCAAPRDMTIVQGTTATLPLQVYADGTPSGADLGVQVTATSLAGRPSGTRTVDVDVEEAWAGIEDVDVTTHCVGSEAPGRTARIVASLEHRASVEQWVRVETAYGISPESDLAPGAHVEVSIPVTAKPWTPGGTATVVVEREIAGVTYAHPILDEYPKADCYVPAWDATATVEAQWIDGSQHLVGTFRNDTSEAMRVRMLGGAYGDSDAATVQPGQTSTFTIDTHGRDVPAGSVTFRLYRWVGDRGHVGYVSPGYEESSYVPDWSAQVSARAVWDGDSMAIVGALRNDTSEAMRVRMLGGAFGDSDAATVQTGQTSTFTIDTGSLGVGPGNVTFRQYRWVIDKGYSHTLPAGYGAAEYAPDWSAQVTAAPACSDDSATLGTTVVNTSAEAMAVVVTTPWGTSAPRDVAPGARTDVTVDTGALTAPPGEVSVTLARTRLGHTFTSTTGAAFEEIDCTVRAATASLATGPPPTTAADTTRTDRRPSCWTTRRRTPP